jgi:pimeloyl-ACP methyl ester carboxylesterase
LDRGRLPRRTSRRGRDGSGRHHGGDALENAALIRKIGPGIPVLLTSGDHDMIVPPSNAKAEFAYYKANCGCDVSQLILPATGHLFMAHKSLPLWIDYVVDWLRSRHITPTR